MNQLGSPDLYSLIRMLRVGTTQAILVVEGPSDSLALTPHINKKETRIVPGYGRTSVEGAIIKADADGIPKVVGLADSDIDDYIPGVTRVESDNLVRTEHYDLESDVFFAEGIVERVVETLVDGSVIRAHIESMGLESVSEAVARIAHTIGMLRIESCKLGHGLQLRELPLKSFIRAEKVHVDYHGLASMIASKSKKSSLTATQIRNLLVSFSNERSLNQKICCGHDLYSVLTGILTVWWRVRASYESVCWSFRSALSVNEISSLVVYKRLKLWGEANARQIWTY